MNLEDISFWIEGSSSGNSTLESHWWTPELTEGISLSSLLHNNYPVKADSFDSITPLVSSQQSDWMIEKKINFNTCGDLVFKTK